VMWQFADGKSLLARKQKGYPVRVRRLIKSPLAWRPIPANPGAPVRGKGKI